MTGAPGSRRGQRAQEEIKLEQELIISTWINEIDFSLKTYDIVSMMRDSSDYSCQTIHNEIFNIPPDSKSMRVLMNPRMRHKTLTCLCPGQD